MERKGTLSPWRRGPHSGSLPWAQGQAEGSRPRPSPASLGLLPSHFLQPAVYGLAWPCSQTLGAEHAGQAQGEDFGGSVSPHLATWAPPTWGPVPAFGVEEEVEG